MAFVKVPRGPRPPPSFGVGACMGWSQVSCHGHPFAIERTSLSTFSPDMAILAMMDVLDIILNAPCE
jgi:hypothetical protein